MNEAGANALYEAERRGVKQLVGGFVYHAGPVTERCALNVLGWSSEKQARYLEMKWGLDPTMAACPLCAQECAGESEVVIHMNDDHKLAFSEIARKLGPDAA